MTAITLQTVAERWPHSTEHANGRTDGRSLGVTENAKCVRRQIRRDDVRFVFLFLLRRFRRIAEWCQSIENNCMQPLSDRQSYTCSEQSLCAEVRQ
jgi:hypothetical protein